MDKQELKNILDKHLKWLRGENGGKRADLFGANLSRANLSRADYIFYITREEAVRKR